MKFRNGWVMSRLRSILFPTWENWRSFAEEWKNLMVLPIISLAELAVAGMEFYSQTNHGSVDWRTGAAGFFTLMLLIAIGIKLTSSGPVLYRQERMGLDGKRFRILKFRTMVKNAEQVTGPVWATTNDPRVTSFGRILRATSLDCSAPVD